VRFKHSAVFSVRNNKIISPAIGNADKIEKIENKTGAYGSIHEKNGRSMLLRRFSFI
jgi:hypothetical protein